jgi:hypothetical protein
MSGRLKGMLEPRLNQGYPMRMLQSSLVGPFFDPPFDSPIEELFALNAVKYLAEDASFEKQVEVPTDYGTYRLDFFVERAGQRLAIECDGREFHNEDRDQWRDALIMGTGRVDVIYRLRGCDLVYHVEDLLYLMSQADPHFFSERGRTNLPKIASDEARAWRGTDLSPGAIVHYHPTHEEYVGNRVRYIFIKRSPRLEPPDRRAGWWDWWKYGKRFKGQCHTVEQLMEKQEWWQNEVNAGRISGDWLCEDCKSIIPRGHIKAVWEQRIVCRQCYDQHYRRHVQS